MSGLPSSVKVPDIVALLYYHGDEMSATFAADQREAYLRILLLMHSNESSLFVAKEADGDDY